MIFRQKYSTTFKIVLLVRSGGFFYIFFCLVLFGVILQAELYLTSSVKFRQNGKTPLRSVTSMTEHFKKHCKSEKLPKIE